MPSVGSWLEGYLSFREERAGRIHMSVSLPPVGAAVSQHEEVIAKRLDAWTVPASFLPVAGDGGQQALQWLCSLVVHVTFRLCRTWGVPIWAEVSCPDSRAIAMRSWTVRRQSTACLDRLVFSFAGRIAPLIKPGIWRTTQKLRVDYRASAEGRYESDQRSEFPAES